MTGPRLSTRLRFGAAALLVAVGAAASLAVAPDLPERMVTRWNAAGEPVGTLSKTAGMWLVPGLAAGLLGMGLMVGADWAGRSVLAPYEWPAGIAASMLGGLYFMWLLRRL